MDMLKAVSVLVTTMKIVARQLMDSIILLCLNGLRRKEMKIIESQK